MANRLKWYKRDPDAALTGMAVLTLEERGAYNTVLDLIYSRDGKVDDDDRFIAGWCRVDVRVWKRIRDRLIDLGKLYIDGTYLRNERADREVSKALLRVASAIDAGKASAAKRDAQSNSSKDLAPTDVERALQLSTSTSTSEAIQREPAPPPSPPVAARAREAAEIAAEVLAPIPISIKADPKMRGFAAWIEGLLTDGFTKSDIVVGIAQSLPSLSAAPSSFDYFRPAIDRAVTARRVRPLSHGNVSFDGFARQVENELGIRRGATVGRGEDLSELHQQFCNHAIGWADVLTTARTWFAEGGGV